MKKTARLFQSIALQLVLVFFMQASHAQNALVFQSDFGLKDGAVSAMKGVAYGVDSKLDIFDLTHDIPVFNIWEGAYRLSQATQYWPTGTVFVSVVDPGVGTNRKSVVLKTKSGHFFVTPDNGTLTLIAEKFGIEEVREIDEQVNRLQGSELSHTFHGRDVYAYTGARLAAGVIKFAEVGPSSPASVKSIPYQKARISEDSIQGSIPILDIRYGNVWTNINQQLFQHQGIKPGDTLCVDIFNKAGKKYAAEMPYVRSFGEVAVGQPVVYINSLLNVAVALNQASFAATHGIEAGADWRIELGKCAP